MSSNDRRGNGTFQVAKGMEAMVRSPDDWRRAELESELLLK